MRRATTWVQSSAQSSSSQFCKSTWFARCTTLQTSVFHNSTRAHTTASPVSTLEASDCASIGKARRTKKAFSELPKSYTAADGTPVSPLVSWSGGLSASASSTVVQSKVPEKRCEFIVQIYNRYMLLMNRSQRPQWLLRAKPARNPNRLV